MITICDIAIGLKPELNEKESLNGEDFDNLGLPMFGGCQYCGASIAAFNAHPGKNGYLVGSCCATEENTITSFEEWMRGYMADLEEAGH